MIEFKIYNFCPVKTSEILREIFKITRKDNLRLISMEDICEEKTSEGCIDLFCQNYCNCYKHKRRMSCDYSTMTTILRFSEKET